LVQAGSTTMTVDSSSMGQSVEDEIAYGGQAVIEGVMMRSRDRVATAVRHPDGDVFLQVRQITRGRVSESVRNIPVLRGIFSLWDMLNLGMKSLAFSAEIALGEDESVSPDSKENEGSLPGNDDSAFVWASLVMGIGGGIILFFVLPLLIVQFIDPFVQSDILSNLIEGIVRICVLVSYMISIGRLSDVRRTFEYHGAEHKTVNALENGVPLTSSEVIKQSITHPRCGTSFLLIIVLISIVVFCFLGRPDLPIRIASRIMFVPIIAGVAFELIRFTAQNRARPWAKVLMGPGMWLQTLTTYPPSYEQCEVAIIAMDAVLPDVDTKTPLVIEGVNIRAC